ncbi:UDP-glucose/GDP-mannose dehydrogenase family protein [Haloechinothrix salitolerans]|uniref:UDP-glucose 6-dehydrogenase n=1 Tax=Haloechinothrix salitolerans TaxID=926830 RepID=A0ABW2BTQ7_9PSEU
MDERICVIGTGYLGATHAACMAELGFEVLGVDVDERKVAMLSEGIVPFAEPGLDDLVSRHVRHGGLRFTTSLAEAAEFATVHFVCVGTPQARDGHGADLGAVFSVVEGLAPLLSQDCLIVGKSTVPAGTAARLTERLAALTPSGVDAEVAWNPEFLREGHAIEDTVRPDRLVLGVASAEAEKILRQLYRQPIREGVPVVVTDVPTAELSKLAANAFLATKISFINAMAEMSDLVGADVVSLADVLGYDDRIGRRGLSAGIGFGGGCLPKDIRALTAQAEELGAGAGELLSAVDVANLRMRERVVELAVEACDSDPRGRQVAVLGAAFKPLSDDVRDSPALHVATTLRGLGARVRVFDPVANDSASRVAPALDYVDSARAAVTGADLVLHLTEWPEFRTLDPLTLGSAVNRRRIVDGRNGLDPDRWRLAGWSYRALGRP